MEVKKNITSNVKLVGINCDRNIQEEIGNEDMTLDKWTFDLRWDKTSWFLKKGGEGDF